jgi:hypothetical protein
LRASVSFGRQPKVLTSIPGSSDDGALLKSHIVMGTLRMFGILGIDGRRQLAVTAYCVHSFSTRTLKRQVFRGSRFRLRFIPRSKFSSEAPLVFAVVPTNQPVVRSPTPYGRVVASLTLARPLVPHTAFGAIAPALSPRIYRRLPRRHRLLRPHHALSGQSSGRWPSDDSCR